MTALGAPLGGLILSFRFVILAGSGGPKRCSTTGNHGYRWLGHPDSDTENRRRSSARPRAPDKEVPDRCGRVPPVGTKTCRPPLYRRGPVEAERLHPADPQLVIDELRKIAGHAPIS